MYNNNTSIFVRLVAVVIICSILLPISVSAVAPTAVQPRASDYLCAYSAYVYLPGNGDVEVYFDVQGTRYMDELGALSIQIYECSTNSSSLSDWTWVKTFTYDSTPGMLGYDDYLYASSVSCQGVVGRYYKAYVCVWAGKNGAGDTRYFWTSAKH